MKLPRDLGGAELARRLGKFGYIQTRQTGSHLRLTAIHAGKEHHITIPKHQVLTVGTFSCILSEIATALGMTREELLHSLFE